MYIPLMRISLTNLLSYPSIPNKPHIILEDRLMRLWLFIFIFGGFFSAQSIDRVYYYHNRPVELDVDGTGLSVAFETAQDALNDAALLNPVLGGLLQKTSKMYGTTKRYIRLTQEVSEAQIEDFIDQINALPQVRMAAPVLKYHGVRQAVDNRFIVRFAEGTSQSAIDALNALYGASVVKQVAVDTWLLEVDKQAGVTGITMANNYLNESIVLWAQPHFIYLDHDLLNATVSDPLHPKQWAHNNTGQKVPTEATPDSVIATPGADMDVPEAWDLLPGGSADIIVAIIDSGVDLDHPDLNDNLVTGADYSGDNDGPDAPGDEAHGTNCAGIVAAEGNNGIGVAGIAYNSKIMPIQIFNSSGSASNADIPGAIDFAWQNGADVLSNSWGGGSPDQAIEDAISRAKTQGRNGKGSAVLFSSGNGSNGNVNYPAYLSTVLAVNAVSMHDEKKNAGSNDYQRWWGGNYGADLDISAPTIVYSTDIIGSAGYNTNSGSAGDYYATFNGTSAACPNAAGVMALILGADTNLTVSQAENIIKRSADKIDFYDYDANGWNKHLGYGRVNARQAVQMAMGNDGEDPLIRVSAEQSSNNTSARTISATITDNTGIASASLTYRTIAGVDTSAWTTVTDTDGPSGDVYEFIIPGQILGTQVQYYLSATDNSAQSNSTDWPIGEEALTGQKKVFRYWVANLSTITYNVTDGQSWGFLSAGYMNSPYTINDNFTIIDANATLNIDGSIADFTIDLETPDNQGVGIATNNSGTAYTNTTLDDEATTPIMDGSSPYSGSFQPDNTLRYFDGKKTQGTWNLRVYDDSYFNNGGTINSWSLTITYTTDDASLPVELTNFSANAKADRVELSWKTRSELENQGFIVERAESKDGPFIVVGDFKNDPSLRGRGSTSEETDYQFTDKNVQPNVTYTYRLYDMDINGARNLAASMDVQTPLSDNVSGKSPLIPEKFALMQNYPNPFNPTTRFQVDIPATDTPQNVRVQIYDIRGRVVRNLFNGTMEPGSYVMQWNGRNDLGQKAPSGLYIYRFISQDFQSSKRMLLVK